MLRPVGDNIAIELIMPSKERAEEVYKRTGLLMPEPDNKMWSFEGIPDSGIIYALPEDYTGELKLGKKVIFKENSPKAMKWEGKQIAFIRINQILGVEPDEPL